MPQSKYLLSFISLDLLPSFPPSAGLSVCRHCRSLLTWTCWILGYQLDDSSASPSRHKSGLFSILRWYESCIRQQDYQQSVPATALGQKLSPRFVGVFRNWKWEKNQELQLLTCIRTGCGQGGHRYHWQGITTHPQDISASVLFCKKRLKPALWEVHGGYITWSHLPCPQTAH